MAHNSERNVDKNLLAMPNSEGGTEMRNMAYTAGLLSAALLVRLTGQARSQALPASDQRSACKR
jgi:hypothetical protein